MAVKLEGDKLIISLNELEQRVLGKAFPAFAPFIELMMKVLLNICFRMLQVDKASYREAIQRIEDGEDGAMVVRDLLDFSDIPTFLQGMASRINPDDLEKYLRDEGYQ